MIEGKKLSRVQVERLLEWIDRKTADEVLVRFSLLYEFAVIEAGGRIYTTAGELKEVFGYKNEEAIRKLLREYDIKPLSLKELTTQLKVGSSKEEISRVFGVPLRNVHRLKLLDYRAFLVVALIQLLKLLYRPKGFLLFHLKIPLRAPTS